MPNGTKFPMEAKFIEVVQDERIVFVATIHDDVRAHTTVTFTEHDGKTTLDMHQVYTRETEHTRGAQQGWTATLNQLAEQVRALVTAQA